MGIIYSALKQNKPEAWELGKNYYRFEELFPPCKFNMNESFPQFATEHTGDDILSQLVKSFATEIQPRWEPGKPTPFVLSELYPTVDDFIRQIEVLKTDAIIDWELPHWRGLYYWAGNDPIMVIGDIDEWSYDDDRQIGCVPIKEYRMMDSWNGKPGRRMKEDAGKASE